MFISKKLARDFKGVYEEQFNQTISVKEAEQMLSDFAEFLKIIITAERRLEHEKQSKGQQA